MTDNKSDTIVSFGIVLFAISVCLLFVYYPVTSFTSFFAVLFVYCLFIYSFCFLFKYNYS